MSAGVPVLVLAVALIAAPRRAPAFDAEEVRIPTAGGEVMLAGTLLRPQGDARAPGILLVQGGSSPFDRDESALGKMPFRALAEALCEAGFATLRVDDRGVGGSGGSKLESTLEELADNVAACLAWLGARDGVDPNRLAIIGHSQGCYLAARAASGPGGPAAVILLAGPGLPVDETLARQLALDGHGVLEENLAMVALARENDKPMLLSLPESLRVLASTLADGSSSPVPIDDLPAFSDVGTVRITPDSERLAYTVERYVGSTLLSELFASRPTAASRPSG